MEAIDDISGFEFFDFPYWYLLLLRLILIFGWLVIDFKNKDVISRTSSEEFVPNNLKTEYGIILCFKCRKEWEVILAQDL